MRLLNNTLNALNGLKIVFNQYAFKIELIVCSFLILFLFFINIPFAYKILLFFALMMVMVVELINTAIEVTLDRVSHKIHPLSKEAKDLGGAAVFVTVLLNIILWVLLVVPALFNIK